MKHSSKLKCSIKLDIFLVNTHRFLQTSIFLKFCLFFFLIYSKNFNSQSNEELKDSKLVMWERPNIPTKSSIFHHTDKESHRIGSDMNMHRNWVKGENTLKETSAKSEPSIHDSNQIEALNEEKIKNKNEKAEKRPAIKLNLRIKSLGKSQKDSNSPDNSFKDSSKNRSNAPHSDLVKNTTENLLETIDVPSPQSTIQSVLHPTHLIFVIDAGYATTKLNTFVFSNHILYKSSVKFFDSLLNLTKEESEELLREIKSKLDVQMMKHSGLKTKTAFVGTEGMRFLLRGDKKNEALFGENTERIEDERVKKTRKNEKKEKKLPKHRTSWSDLTKTIPKIFGVKPVILSGVNEGLYALETLNYLIEIDDLSDKISEDKLYADYQSNKRSMTGVNDLNSMKQDMDNNLNSLVDILSFYNAQFLNMFSKENSTNEISPKANSLKENNGTDKNTKINEQTRENQKTDEIYNKNYQINLQNLFDENIGNKDHENFTKENPSDVKTSSDKSQNQDSLISNIPDKKVSKGTKNEDVKRNNISYQKFTNKNSSSDSNKDLPSYKEENSDLLFNQFDKKLNKTAFDNLVQKYSAKESSDPFFNSVEDKETFVLNLSENDLRARFNDFGSLKSMQQSTISQAFAPSTGIIEMGGGSLQISFSITMNTVPYIVSRSFDKMGMRGMKMFKKHFRMERILGSAYYDDDLVNEKDKKPSSKLKHRQEKPLCTDFNNTCVSQFQSLFNLNMFTLSAPVYLLNDLYLLSYYYDVFKQVDITGVTNLKKIVEVFDGTCLTDESVPAETCLKLSYLIFTLKSLGVSEYAALHVQARIGSMNLAWSVGYAVGLIE